MRAQSKYASVEDRFWAKVDKGAECWRWTARVSPAGYGMFGPGGGSRKLAYAHRFAYELVVGPIPEGMEIDHLCRNRACVNPAHLEPVTHRENGLRGVSPSAVNAQKTHCKYGHPFTPENTYAWPSAPHTRACRECHRRREGERYQQQRRKRP